MNTLFYAKKTFSEAPTPENEKAFLDSVAASVRAGDSFIVPARKVSSGYSLCLFENRGEMLFGMYTSTDNIKPAAGISYLPVNINRVIDAVYSGPRASGIVLDPDTSPLYLNRRQINEFTDRKDPRLAERDWGEGIPHYGPDDLMVIEEFMYFAMAAVMSCVTEQGEYTVREVNNSPVYLPNLVLEKNGEIYYAAVETSVAPEIAELSAEKRKSLTELAAANGAKCLYAAVGFGSADPERFMNRVALVGDRYMINFAGFREV